MQDKRLSEKLKISENEIKKLTKDYLNIRGWYHFHILQGMGAFKGIPDIIAIKGGRVLFIECKTIKGRQSDHQIEFQRNIEYQGGEYVLVDCLEKLIERGV